MTKPALPQEGGTYTRDKKGGLKKVNPKRPAAPLPEPKTNEEKA